MNPFGAEIPFSRPTRAASELSLLEEALQSGHLAGDGPFTREGSEILGEVFDGAQVLLTTSGTHALELAALLMKIGPGDEVVMPSFTFSSTANAFALRGATIRFADVDPGTFSMERAEVEAALTPSTTAVVAMPYGGVIRDMGAIADLCRERGLKFMEDNAHGVFGRSRGKSLGTFAPLAAQSFHQTKNISCGEGGALVINREEFEVPAEIIREKGTDRSRFLRGEVDKYTWRSVGSSYLPSEVLAALLVSQLRERERIQRERHRVWDLYRGRLEPLVDELGIQLQEIPEGMEHPAHVFGLLVGEDRNRGDVLKQLKTHGIRATSHYEPLHRAPANTVPRVLPITDFVASNLVRLPLFADLSSEEADFVVTTLIHILRRG